MRPSGARPIRQVHSTPGLATPARFLYLKNLRVLAVLYVQSGEKGGIVLEIGQVGWCPCFAWMLIVSLRPAPFPEKNKIKKTPTWDR